jgi:hypothetical protein
MGLLLASAVLTAPLAGCESSQDKSARLARDGATLLTGEKGLVVHHQNADVRAVETAIVHDENGAAVVVTLRNRAAQAVGRVPIAIDLRGASGKSVYKNDAPGLDPSLVEATAIPARGEVVWVDDQILPAETPKAASARVGQAKGDAPRELPHIELASPTLKDDAVTGIEAVGRVTNVSKVEQKRLVVFCVARKGGKVVAAGRAIVDRLAPGKHKEFHVFFIGDPRDAQLSAAAPPTVLE